MDIENMAGYNLNRWKLLDLREMSGYNWNDWKYIDNNAHYLKQMDMAEVTLNGWK